MNWKIVIPMLAAVFAVGMANGLLGGLSDADINETSVKNALKFAVVQHNLRSNAMYVAKVANVVKVQKQVVAGMKYIFTVQMANTSCRKGGTEEVCTIPTEPSQTQPYQCKFTVWVRPWMNSTVLTDHSCLN